ncbi:MAG: fibrillarin-like rRNA/tRNA 2'-O-methyltransferase [Candidatus Altiarchaeota archaeon]
MKEIFPGVYSIKGKIATLNSAKGYRVYGEKTFREGGKEYRIWDPNRSKVAAAIAKGLTKFPVKNNSNILYLGASTGTTSSHIADITSGKVYCIEFSRRMMRDLLNVCARKKNMIPILADARKPGEYCHRIGPVDVLIQDVAQPDQAGILLANQSCFGFKNAMFSIKARSINSIRKPKQVINEELSKLSSRFEIIEKIDLQPFEKDHTLVSLKTR